MAALPTREARTAARWWADQLRELAKYLSQLKEEDYLKAASTQLDRIGAPINYRMSREAVKALTDSNIKKFEETLSPYPFRTNLGSLASASGLSVISIKSTAYSALISRLRASPRNWRYPTHIPSLDDDCNRARQGSRSRQYYQQGSGRK